MLLSIINITEWPTIVQCMIVVISQFAYSNIRMANIQHAMHGSIAQNIVSNTGIVATWLLSLSLGLKSMMDGNIAILLSYLISAAVGNVPLLIKQGRPLFKHKTNNRVHTSSNIHSNGKKSMQSASPATNEKSSS